MLVPCSAGLALAACLRQFRTTCAASRQCRQRQQRGLSAGNGKSCAHASQFSLAEVHVLFLQGRQASALGRVSAPQRPDAFSPDPYRLPTDTDGLELPASCTAWSFLASSSSVCPVLATQPRRVLKVSATFPCHSRLCRSVQRATDSSCHVTCGWPALQPFCFNVGLHRVVPLRST